MHDITFQGIYDPAQPLIEDVDGNLTEEGVVEIFIAGSDEIGEVSNGSVILKQGGEELRAAVDWNTPAMDGDTSLFSDEFGGFDPSEEVEVKYSIRDNSGNTSETDWMTISPCIMKNSSTKTRAKTKRTSPSFTPVRHPKLCRSGNGTSGTRSGFDGSPDWVAERCTVEMRSY